MSSSLYNILIMQCKFYIQSRLPARVPSRQLFSTDISSRFHFPSRFFIRIVITLHTLTNSDFQPSTLFISTPHAKPDLIFDLGFKFLPDF